MKSLKAIKTANLCSVNKAAKKALDSLKEPIQRDQIHVFQLIEWAIRKNIAQSNEILDWTILKAQEAPPVKALKMMGLTGMKNLPTEPKELALSLIQEIEAWIRDEDPDYQAEVRFLNRMV